MSINIEYDLLMCENNHDKIIYLGDNKAKCPLCKIIEETLETILSLCSDEECSLDHHGNCQTHGWIGDDCPHKRAKRLIAIYGKCKTE